MRRAGGARPGGGARRRGGLSEFMRVGVRLDVGRWAVLRVSRSAVGPSSVERDVGVGAVWSVGDMIGKAHGLVERSWSCGRLLIFT